MILLISTNTSILEVEIVTLTNFLLQDNILKVSDF